MNTLQHITFHGSVSPHHHDVQSCRLIEGFFAYAVQALLGIVAIAALLIKYHLEIRSAEEGQTVRSFKEWCFDCGKQAIAAVFSHVCNIVIAIMFAHIKLKGKEQPDQCAWYFINFCGTTSLFHFCFYLITASVDAALGVGLIIVLLKSFEFMAHIAGWECVEERYINFMH